MTEEHERLLRAMLDARRAYEASNEVQRKAWEAYLKAQAAFTGKFAATDYPLGPFVVGSTLIEHDYDGEKWPQSTTQFTYKEIVRCPTSD